MLSFHNSAEIKEKFLKRVRAHRKADNLIQGTGWENGKGCAVGCTLENYDHSRYPIELGLPEWLAQLEDHIFEGLDSKSAQLWPEKFLKAIPVGISEDKFTQLYHKLAIKRQQRNLKLQKEQYKKTPKPYLKQVINAIKFVIKYHQKPTKQLRSAAKLAAESAARLAESAWLAAELARALWLATKSAWSSAYKQEAKDLLSLLKGLKK